MVFSFWFLVKYREQKDQDGSNLSVEWCNNTDSSKWMGAAKLQTMTDKLLIEKRPNGVTVLTFNRPDSRNALDLETMRQFAEAMSDLANDSDLRAVIVTGAGKDAFCSGGDLIELSAYPAENDARQMSALMGDALLALERLPVPVIAAINGYALGGGSEVAMACDLRIADETARMAFVQIRMGLTPGWGAGQRLLRLVGYARAMEFLLRGNIMRSAELEAVGLVNRVVEAGSALTHALIMADQIAASPPDVVRGIKRLLQAGLSETPEQAHQIERDIFPPLWAADAHLQAVENFLSRNKTLTPNPSPLRRGEHVSSENSITPNQGHKLE
jgi:enoyl-CoA hydratase